MIEERISAADLADGPVYWDAAADFGGPPAPTPEPLEPWEAYAQVLLASNEFLFVD